MACKVFDVKKGPDVAVCYHAYQAVWDRDYAYPSRALPLGDSGDGDDSGGIGNGGGGGGGGAGGGAGKYDKEGIVSSGKGVRGGREVGLLQDGTKNFRPRKHDF